MPKMQPLREWACDKCGKKVTEANGHVEWLSGGFDEGPHDFYIVHNRPECRFHGDKADQPDLPIGEFLGLDGLQHLLSMLSVGPVLDPNGVGVAAPEMESFVDVVRRLQIPYYEEARRYFTAARQEGYFLDNDAASIFAPRTCEAIIKRYEN